MAVSRVSGVVRLLVPVQKKSFFSVGSALKQSPQRSFSVARCLREKYYSKEHEWVKVEGQIGSVGISNYAQETLGEIVYVELPEVDADVNQDDVVGVVESVKAASDVMSPVSGVIKSVNNVLSEKPGLVNKDPENEGWLYKIEMSDSSELGSLMNETAYKAFCEENSS